MAVEIPVVVDIEQAFKDAANRVPSAIKPLQNSIRQLEEDLAFWKDEMKGVSVSSKDFEVAAKEIRQTEEALDLLNSKVSEFVNRTGSVRRLSGDLAVIQQQFERMGAAQMFDASGNLSADAKKLQQDYSNVATELDRVRSILTAEYEAQKRNTEEAERQKKAAMEHQQALTMTANSMNDLNTKLAAWRQELASSDVGSQKWNTAAQNVAALSARIQEVNVQVKRLGTESGSIDRLNTVIQEMNRQWNAMGYSDKFVPGTNQLTSGAQQLVRNYRAATNELEKQGKSLSTIIQEQIQIEQRIQSATNKRKYEDLVLKSTANTMGRLSEQARILSERLNNAKFGTKRYDELRTKLEEVRRKMQEVQGSTGAVTTEMKKQSVVLQNITSIASMYFSVFGALRFIRNVRETTSEFEMQRVALGGIIQDANKAESLFKEIKATAIKSPFEIKELVTYTKQLSAYRIETDKLFEVTTKLADVSAGLGVDMNRLVLAYGQVKAASVLRGQELRQFTEAGIPLVDLLADKFRELGREGTTTADVFELISKRAVPFEMVAEIFDDMTEKGGIFYKMQEKQAETLAGQWSNLKDALSIMYDEIGNTTTVHSAMERLISDAKFLFNNWRIIGEILKGVAIQYGAVKFASLFIPTLTKDTALAAKATAAKAKATKLDAANEAMANVFRTIAISQLKAYAKHMNAAAAASTLLGRGWHQLAASFLGGGWIGIATTAITVLVGWLVSARKEAERLGNELSKNIASGKLETDQSIRNFERLANTAVMAANGSAEQRDALKELQRTYGDIIPAQDLQIKKLQELKGNYESLTQAIREKIDVQTHEQNINQITDTFASTLGAQRKGLESFLRKEEGYSVEEATRIISGVEKAIKDGLLSIETDFMDAARIIERIAEEQVGHAPLSGFGQAFQTTSGFFAFKSYYQKLLQSTSEFNSALEDEDRRFSSLNNELGIYADKIKEIREDTSKTPAGFTLEQAGTFEFREARWKQAIERYKKELKTAFGSVDISDAFTVDDFIDFEKIFKNVSSSKGTLGLKGFVTEIQKDYLKLAPQESSTRLITEGVKRIANEIGISMSAIQGYLKEDGKTMEEYAKSVDEFAKAQKNNIKELKWQQENYHEGISNFVRPTDDDIAKEQKEADFLDKLLEFVKQFLKVTKTGGGGYTQDPFIKQLQERMKFMQDFKNGYDDLSKYMAKAGALGKESEIMLTRGLSLGIDAAEQKRAAEDLSKWYEDTYNAAFDYLKKNNGVTGTLQDFLSRQITGNTNRDKMLRDFQGLIQSLFDAKTDFDTSQMKKSFDDALKKLSDEIKRSETARNFYQDILGLTGDEQLAASMSVSVYGGIGDEFKDRMQKQLNGALESLKVDKNFTVTDDIEKAFSEMDFKKILAIDGLPEEVEKVVRQAYENSQKYDADLLKNFAELISKYGDTAQKVATIRAKAENEINKVKDALKLSLENTKLTPEERKALQERADEIIRALEGQRDLDEFKAGEDYIKFFSEINVMTAEQAAEVRGKLRDAYLKAFNDGAISADQLRRNLRAVDEQFKKLSESTTLLGSYLSGGFDAANEKLREYADNITVLAAKMQSGKELDQAEQSYVSRMLKRFGGDGVKNAKSYGDLLNAFSNSGGLKAAGQALGNMGKGMSAIASKGAGALAIVDAIFQAVHSTITSIQQMIDELNRMRSEDNKVGEWFKYVSDFDKYTYSGWEKLKSGDVIGATADAVSSWISIFNNIQEDKVKRINEDIEDQEELLDDLQYSYERLDKVIQKSFGSEYIYNYQKQLENLQAQADAYRKQAELERGKGKSADEDVAKDYEKQARNIEDQIADMRTQLSEFFAGTDLTSAAEDFANAWIEAYKEFGSTTDAMSEKFNDMIQNMITRSLAAKIMQEMLQPIFDQIDTMSQDGLLATDEIAAIAALAQERIPLINDAMTNLMTSLASAGLDVRASTAGFHGISKDIAGASEESILGLAAAINTQNFYISYVPTISENVSQILAAMTGGVSPTAPVETTETGEVLPSVQRMVYDHLPNMDANLAEVLRLVRSVITTKNGTTNTNYVAIK